MPILIKNIEGRVFGTNKTDVVLIKTIFGEIQKEDYIDFSSLTAFLQDFSKIEKTSGLTNPLNFGLKNTMNKQMITLNINY